MLNQAVELFQHTAARRRLPLCAVILNVSPNVSTHSRPKAAATTRLFLNLQARVSTHSRPKAAAHRIPPPRFLAVFQHTAARRRLPFVSALFNVHKGVSTHSRPKAAASEQQNLINSFVVSTHSRPKAAARQTRSIILRLRRFQHTAARRRLRHPPIRYKHH